MSSELSARAEYESFISGGRLSFPEGWMRMQVLRANTVARRKGWDGSIELVYEDRVTSLFTATIFFKIRGPRPLVQALVNALKKCVEG